MKISRLITFLFTLVPSLGYSITFECKSIEANEIEKVYQLEIDSTKTIATISPKVDLHSDKNLTFISETSSFLNYRDQINQDAKWLTFLTLDKKTGILKVTLTGNFPDKTKNNDEYQFKKEPITYKRLELKPRLYKCD